MFGYKKNILWINLSNGKIWRETLTEQTARNFIGGRGLSMKIMYDRLKAGSDPLAPDNIILIVTGPMQGTVIPCSGRYVLTTKSPLTGLVQDAHSGGYFGPEVKYAGYDAIAITGRATGPVYVLIRDDNVEIRDGKNLWGKDVFLTDKAIKRECSDEELKIATIGQAGERLVQYSCVMNEWYRAAARNGSGAVMASKNLKAIAVRGTGPVEVNDIGTIKKIYGKLRKQISISENGTAGGLETFSDLAILPVKNFTWSVFKGAEKIDGHRITRTRMVKQRACFACIKACTRVCAINKGKYAKTFSEGPEYETSWSFGAQCDNDNLDSIIKANMLCNKYGLDTISAGNAIGFAIECHEKGILSEEDCDGLKLHWGNHQAIVALVEKIALREGIGKLLGEGVKKAADSIGKGAEKLAMHVRGLEIPAYEPRAVQGMALSLATTNCGAQHTKAYTPGVEIWANTLVEKPMDPLSPDGKAWIVKKIQESAAVVDSLIVCTFISPQSSGETKMEDFAEWMQAVVGFKMTTEDLWRTGERIYNLERALEIREGLEGADDALPERFLKEPLPSGPAKGHTAKLNEMLPEYYKERGWANGVPTKQKLQELGLDYVADDLKELGVLP